MYQVTQTLCVSVHSYTLTWMVVLYMPNWILYMCSVDDTLRRLGLRMVSVLGDGHCFFRTLEHLQPACTFMHWRTRLADFVQAKADHDGLHRWYLDRFNAIASERAGGSTCSTFEQFIQVMRRHEWGYADWITEFSCIEQAVVLVVDHTGGLSQTRHRSVATVRHVYCMINQATAAGNK